MVQCSMILCNLAMLLSGLRVRTEWPCGGLHALWLAKYLRGGLPASAELVPPEVWGQHGFLLERRSRDQVTWPLGKVSMLIG